MYFLEFSQKLSLSLESCWDFFSSPANLKIITPKHLGFEISADTPDEKMYAGQIIAYTLYPLWNIPISWVTEITHVNEPHYFIDEQRLGPYRFWHHEHRFQPVVNGVEVVDCIYYAMPWGILGKTLHALKVKKDLTAIFSYRRAALEKRFGAIL